MTKRLQGPKILPSTHISATQVDGGWMTPSTHVGDFHERPISIGASALQPPHGSEHSLGSVQLRTASRFVEAAVLSE